MIITGVQDITPVVDGNDAVVYTLVPSLSSLNIDASRTLELSCTVRLYRSEGEGVPVAQTSGNLSLRGYDANGNLVSSSVATSTNGQITFLSSAGNNQCMRFRIDYVKNSQSVTYITVPVILSGKRDRFCGYWNANTTYYDDNEVNDNVVLLLDNGSEQAYERKGGGTVRGATYKPNTTTGQTKWKAIETNPKTYFKTVLAMVVSAQEGDFDRLHALDAFFKNVTIEGVFRNLITEIDYRSGYEQNTDLIFKKASDVYIDGQRVTSAVWYLDVLRCGNIIRIKSLPSDSSLSGSVGIHLPYFINNGKYCRNFTKAPSYTDTAVLENPRLMTADEMRMLVNKRIVIILDYASGYDFSRFAQTFITAHTFVPNGTQEWQIKNIANGWFSVNSGASADNLKHADVNIGRRRTIFLECKMLYDVEGFYSYLWTSTATDPSTEDQSGELIDNVWD